MWRTRARLKQNKATVRIVAYKRQGHRRHTSHLPEVRSLNENQTERKRAHSACLLQSMVTPRALARLRGGSGYQERGVKGGSGGEGERSGESGRGS
eukprot:1191483-Prorocentrum_minimum.AAC.6